MSNPPLEPGLQDLSLYYDRLLGIDGLSSPITDQANLKGNSYLNQTSLSQSSSSPYFNYVQHEVKSDLQEQNVQPQKLAFPTKSGGGGYSVAYSAASSGGYNAATLKLKQDLTAKELQIIELRSHQVNLESELEDTLQRLQSQVEKNQTDSFPFSQGHLEQTEVEKALRKDVANLVSKMKKMHAKCNEKITRLNHKARSAVAQAEKMRKQAADEAVGVRQQNQLQGERIDELRQRMIEQEGVETNLKHQVECYLSEINLHSEKARQEMDGMQRKCVSLDNENAQLRNLFMAEKQRRTQAERDLAEREMLLTEGEGSNEELSREYTALLEEMKHRENHQKIKDDNNKLSLEKLHLNISRLTAHLTKKNNRLAVLEKQLSEQGMTHHLEDNHAASQAELRAKDSRISDYQDLTSSLRGDLDRCRAELQHQRFENLREPSQTVNSASTSLDAYNIQSNGVGDLQSIVSNKDKEILNLRTQISSLQELAELNKMHQPESAKNADNGLNQHLKKMLSSRNDELQELYQQVVYLTEQVGVKDDKFQASQTELAQIQRKLELQVAYINELQQLNDKMYSENKSLQQKLRAFEASPSEAQEEVSQLRDELNKARQHCVEEEKKLKEKFQVEKQELEDRQKEQDQRWSEHLELKTAKLEQITATLLASQNDLAKKNKAEEELVTVVHSVRAEAETLSKIQEVRAKGDRPDVSMLVGAQHSGEWEATESFDSVKLVSLLAAADAKFVAFRGHIADSYAQSVGDDCAIQ